MAHAPTTESELDDIVQVVNQDSQSIQSFAASPSSDVNEFVTAPGTSEEDNIDSESDDDDDSRSNHSSTNHINHFVSSDGSRHSALKSSTKGEQKRSHHNVLERRRRDLLKDSFTKLRDSVPTFQKERVSRADILKKAAEFIQFTVKKNAGIQAEIDELVRKNKELERHKEGSSTDTTTVAGQHKIEPIATFQTSVKEEQS